MHMIKKRYFFSFIFSITILISATLHSQSDVEKYLDYKGKGYSIGSVNSHNCNQWILFIMEKQMIENAWKEIPYHAYDNWYELCESLANDFEALKKYFSHSNQNNSSISSVEDDYFWNSAGFLHASVQSENDLRVQWAREVHYNDALISRLMVWENQLTKLWEDMLHYPSFFNDEKKKKLVKRVYDDLHKISSIKSDIDIFLALEKS